MSDGVTREAAAGLLKKYNKEEFHLLHALTVEGVMRWYANDLGFADEKDGYTLSAPSTTKSNGAAFNYAANLAFPARVAIPRIQAVDRLCQNFGTGGLSRSARPCK